MGNLLGAQTTLDFFRDGWTREQIVEALQNNPEKLAVYADFVTKANIEHDEWVINQMTSTKEALSKNLASIDDINITGFGNVAQCWLNKNPATSNVVQQTVDLIIQKLQQ